MDNNEIYVDVDSFKNVIEINNNNAKYYEELAKSHLKEAIKCLSNCGEYFAAIQKIKKDCELIRTYIDRDYLPELSEHTENQENPHNVTAEQIGACLTSDLSNVALSGDYNDLINIPYIPSGVVIDQTYDRTSANAQSGVAVYEAISGKQNTLVSGTNIKTINNTSLLGSGNVAVQSVISDLATIRSGASKGATSVQPSDLSGYEQTSNKVISLSSSSTNTQYPSAKCVYDTCQSKVTITYED